MVVHEREEAHDELAVHAIGDTAVAGDRLAEVLDLESALQTGCEETAKGSDQRGKSGESQDVELNGLHPESLVQAEQLKRVRLGREDRVRDTLQSGQGICTQVVDGTDEVLVTHEEAGHEVTEANSADPCANETLDGLLRRELDQLRASKCNSADVGKDIVRNDQRGGEEEPDHALENVVHHEVSLNHNQVQGHMGPSKLSELESVVTLLQGSNEEHEACQLILAETNRSSRSTYP